MGHNIYSAFVQHNPKTCPSLVDLVMLASDAELMEVLRPYPVIFDKMRTMLLIQNRRDWAFSYMLGILNSIRYSQCTLTFDADMHKAYDLLVRAGITQDSRIPEYEQNFSVK